MATHSDDSSDESYAPDHDSVASFTQLETVLSKLASAEHQLELKQEEVQLLEDLLAEQTKDIEGYKQAVVKAEFVRDCALGDVAALRAQLDEAGIDLPSDVDDELPSPQQLSHTLKRRIESLSEELQATKAELAAEQERGHKLAELTAKAREQAAELRRSTASSPIRSPAPSPTHAPSGIDAEALQRAHAEELAAIRASQMQAELTASQERERAANLEAQLAELQRTNSQLQRTQQEVLAAAQDAADASAWEAALSAARAEAAHLRSTMTKAQHTVEAQLAAVEQAMQAEADRAAAAETRAAQAQAASQHWQQAATAAQATAEETQRTVSRLQVQLKAMQGGAAQQAAALRAEADRSVAHAQLRAEVCLTKIQEQEAAHGRLTTELDDAKAALGTAQRALLAAQRDTEAALQSAAAASSESKNLSAALDSTTSQCAKLRQEGTLLQAQVHRLSAALAKAGISTGHTASTGASSPVRANAALSVQLSKLSKAYEEAVLQNSSLQAELDDLRAAWPRVSAQPSRDRAPSIRAVSPAISVGPPTPSRCASPTSVLDVVADLAAIAETDTNVWDALRKLRRQTLFA